jgi:hypothetical protein
MKAVKWVSGLTSVEYEDRCREIGLDTLEMRRWQQDMTQVYKILRGVGNIDEARFFTRIGERSTVRTRMAAGVDNLVPKRARTDLRKNCFSSRVIGSWNGLPDNVKSASNVSAFKNGIKNFIENGLRPSV